MTTKTLHGCTCLKDWVKIDGKKYSGCVYGVAEDTHCPMTTDKYAQKNTKCSKSYPISHCPVEEGCGVSPRPVWEIPARRTQGREMGVLKGTGYWDICEPETPSRFGHPKSPNVFFRMSRLANIKGAIGHILFLGIAGFLIPYLLQHTKHSSLVHVWVPNIDVIATVFAFRGGFMESDFFRFLYTDAPNTHFSFWSSLIIEYFALLGLALITAQMVWKRKSISKGLSYAIVMLLLSWLIPNSIIETIMHYIYTHLDRKKRSPLWAKWNLETQISILGGFLAAIGFILIERVIIDNYLHKIDKLSSFIVNKLWYSLGQGGKPKK